VLELFDRLTIGSCYRDTLQEKNIHYFNGWKTNNAFKVGARVVVAVSSGYGGSFWDYGRWNLNHKSGMFLDDFDKVMAFFDGMVGYKSLTESIQEAFKQGENVGTSTYFKFSAYKKGTIHLAFRNLDILRRFNVVACRGKGWLPEDYGKKPLAELTTDKAAVVEAFEGSASYSKNHKSELFRMTASAQIVG
jgi:hypothetical protein